MVVRGPCSILHDARQESEQEATRNAEPFASTRKAALLRNRPPGRARLRAGIGGCRLLRVQARKINTDEFDKCTLNRRVERVQNVPKPPFCLAA